VKKWLILIGVVVVIGVFIVLNLTKEGSRVEVRTTEVLRRDITKFVTASGRIQPKRQVNVSASAIGKVTRVAVEEGDYVEKGTFLLQIDPTDYQSAVDELNASMRAARATLTMEEANLTKAEYDLERAIDLHEKDVVSEENMRTARLNVDVTQARRDAASESLSQYKALLKKASHGERDHGHAQ
jgi:HlyD family secretion protein